MCLCMWKTEGGLRCHPTGDYLLLFETGSLIGLKLISHVDKAGWPACPETSLFLFLQCWYYKPCMAFFFPFLACVHLFKARILLIELLPDTPSCVYSCVLFPGSNPSPSRAVTWWEFRCPDQIQLESRSHVILLVPNGCLPHYSWALKAHTRPPLHEISAVVLN